MGGAFPDFSVCSADLEANLRLSRLEGEAPGDVRARDPLRSLGCLAPKAGRAGGEPGKISGELLRSLRGDPWEPL